MFTNTKLPRPYFRCQFFSDNLELVNTLNVEARLQYTNNRKLVEAGIILGNVEKGNISLPVPYPCGCGVTCYCV